MRNFVKQCYYIYCYLFIHLFIYYVSVAFGLQYFAFHICHQLKFLFANII